MGTYLFLWCIEVGNYKRVTELKKVLKTPETRPFHMTAETFGKENTCCYQQDIATVHIVVKLNLLLPKHIINYAPIFSTVIIYE